MNCGIKISPACENFNLPMDEAGFKEMMGNTIGSLTFLLTVAAQIGADTASLNWMKAVNAARCAIVNLGDNSFYFVASLFYFNKQFGSLDPYIGKIKVFARHACTCKKETDAMAAKFGGTKKSSEVFGSCSEASQQRQQDEDEAAAA